MVSGRTSSSFFSTKLAAPKKALRSVLIVDDNEMNRTLIKRLLSKIIGADVAIAEATNGDEAINKAKGKLALTCEPFDLIIMDYEMPLKNGVEATAGIREIERQCGNNRMSYILSWSTSFNENGSKVYPLANDAINKPVNLFELKSKLNTNWYLAPNTAEAGKSPAMPMARRLACA